MTGPANVLSIQALEEFKTALARFSTEASTILRAAVMELQRTQEWLAERQRYWQSEVRRRQAEYEAAQLAFDRCVEAAARSGAVGAMACAPLQARVTAALKQLRGAQEELQNVVRWARAVQQVAVEYQRAAQRLSALLTQQLPRANALLSRKLDTLHEYMGITAPPAGSPPTLHGVLSTSSATSSTPNSSDEIADPVSLLGAAMALAFNAGTVSLPLGSAQSSAEQSTIEGFYVEEPQRDTSPTTTAEELEQRVRQYEAEKIEQEQAKLEEIQARRSAASAEQKTLTAADTQPMPKVHPEADAPPPREDLREGVEAPRGSPERG